MTVQVITENTTAHNGTDTSGGPFTGEQAASLRSNASTTNADDNADGHPLEVINTVSFGQGNVVIKFSLANIPAGQAISSALLYLAPSGTGDLSLGNSTINAYRLLRDFTQTETTWTVYSAGNNWGTAGAENTTTDRQASATGAGISFSSADITNKPYKSIDVTADVAAAYAGAYSARWVLKATSFSDDRYLYIGGKSNNDGNRPELVVTYAPAASAVPLFTTNYQQR